MAAQDAFKHGLASALNIVDVTRIVITNFTDVPLGRRRLLASGSGGVRIAFSVFANAVSRLDLFDSLMALADT